jgi:hypothetical protein
MEDDTSWKLVDCRRTKIKGSMLLTRDQWCQIWDANQNQEFENYIRDKFTDKTRTESFHDKYWYISDIETLENQNHTCQWTSTPTVHPYAQREGW